MKDINSLIGKTLISAKATNNEIVFETEDEIFRFNHDQSCCESVYVDDISGDLQDLVGSPILKAEESTNHHNPKEEYTNSFTWTFYLFATIKGYVNIKWYGKSNGYYSERVNLKITQKHV